MKDFLVLQLQAPLMSFGSVIVDNFGYTSDMPGVSMITGLIGNALGYYHSDFDKLHKLQNSITMGIRRVKCGQKITDYQTVDFSQPYLPIKGWTTTGIPDERKGGTDSKKGTHIRYRDYWADALFYVVLSIQEKKNAPSLKEIREALIHPARPLFIGRKNCLPALPIFWKQIQAKTIKQALLSLDSPQIKTPSTQMIWYPTRELSVDGSIITVYDLRNWKLGVHTGSRLVKRELIEIQELTP